MTGSTSPLGLNMARLFRKYQHEFLVGAGLILSLVLRYLLFDFASRDYIGFFSHWYDYIIENGGYRALGHKFSNYNPPYLYMIVCMIYLFPWLSKIVAMKVISVTFDLVLGFFFYKLIAIRHEKSLAAFYGLMAFLFAPTVFLNSALWGQADSIYTAGLVASLYWICKNKQWHAMAAFAFSFSIKAQAIFFAPFLAVLLVKRVIQRRTLIMIPAIYLLALIPAWLAGRSFTEMLMIYARQSSTYQELSKHAPTLYTWFPDSSYEYLYPAGLVLAISVVFLLIVGAVKSSKQIGIHWFIQFAFISVLTTIFFLPKMHERYFYPADVLSIVYAFYFQSTFLFRWR
jgi:Gpi18-like mannosyltransferase